MKRILVPIKSKLKPLEVEKELKKFKQIHKSPYSQTYYDTKDISWEHKPEGSLRISDIGTLILMEKSTVSYTI
ncbi:hypothetical protein H477_3606 [[Clostridium] sordellii ATCC 9714]|nr:hypothetical protein H477_3606 [[Clostridium] sordellii ATCC 9714] [Paeniclostridium sordellii ATCC 9714]